MMDVIELPFLFRYITLRESVETMKEVQRAGVVIRKQTLDYFLLRAAEIYAALANRPASKDLSLRDVEKGIRVHEISDSDVSKWNLNLDDPSQTYSNFEALLDQRKTGYGLLASSSRPGFVRIVTRHEGLVGQMNFAPKACCCDHEPMHFYPPPAKSHGEICFCGHPISCYK
jgi:hypothetical protein